MTREEILEALAEIEADCEETFEGDELAPRLSQIKDHIATLRMTIEHAHDDRERAAAGN